MKRFLNPLPSVPVEVLPRWKDQVDIRYALYVGIVVPLWRKVTKPWRHPFCRWPVKCNQVPVEPRDEGLRTWPSTTPSG